MLGVVQRGVLTSSFTDHQGGRSGRDLPLAEPPERSEIDLAGIVERCRKIGNIAHQPCGGMMQ